MESKYQRTTNLGWFSVNDGRARALGVVYWETLGVEQRSSTSDWLKTKIETTKMNKKHGKKWVDNGEKTTRDDAHDNGGGVRLCPGGITALLVRVGWLYLVSLCELTTELLGVVTSGEPCAWKIEEKMVKVTKIFKHPSSKTFFGTKNISKSKSFKYF